MYLDQHVVILPYFSQQEVDRYIKIANYLKRQPTPNCRVHFLLANSLRIEPSIELFEAYREIGPCTSFECPTPVFGYPEGPTAMYWDCMKFVGEKFSDLSGFCLWLESDMAPVKPDWIDRLSNEWFTGERPLMMGCHVPDIYKKRIFRKPKLILHAHINGGACYSMDFATRLPENARQGVFDMAVYNHAQQLGKIRNTDLISFSTLSRVRRDVQSENKVLLHGFMQDKDQFIDSCLRPISEFEKRAAPWHEFQESLERFKRTIKVQFVRRGSTAMLENMLLTKQNYERQQRVA